MIYLFFSWVLYKNHCASNRRQLDCLFNSLFRLIPGKISKLRSVPWWGKSTGHLAMTRPVPATWTLIHVASTQPSSYACTHMNCTHSCNFCAPTYLAVMHFDLYTLFTHVPVRPRLSVMAIAMNANDTGWYFEVYLAFTGACSYCWDTLRSRCVAVTFPWRTHERHTKVRP